MCGGGGGGSSAALRFACSEAVRCVSPLLCWCVVGRPCSCFPYAPVQCDACHAFPALRGAHVRVRRSVTVRACSSVPRCRKMPNVYSLRCAVPTCASALRVSYFAHCVPWPGWSADACLRWRCLTCLAGGLLFSSWLYYCTHGRQRGWAVVRGLPCKQRRWGCGGTSQAEGGEGEGGRVHVLWTTRVRGGRVGSGRGEPGNSASAYEPGNSASACAACLAALVLPCSRLAPV